MDSIPRGRYRHFKGNEYEVVDVALDSETQQPVVIYRALYGERGLWVRPLTMFTEVIERNGARIRRFEYIGDAASPS
jgi:cyclomaltodextrinase / maltogenic alpha-amylase / neopullulanase